MSGIARALEAGTIEGGNKFITSLQSAKGLVDSGAIDRNGVIGGLGTGGFAGAGIRGEESRRTEGSKYLAGLEAKSRIAANETQGLGIQYGKLNEKDRIEAMSSIQARSGMGFLNQIGEGLSLREKYGGIGLDKAHEFTQKVLSAAQKGELSKIKEELGKLDGFGEGGGGKDDRKNYVALRDATNNMINNKPREEGGSETEHKKYAAAAGVVSDMINKGAITQDDFRKFLKLNTQAQQQSGAEKAATEAEMKGMFGIKEGIFSPETESHVRSMSKYKLDSKNPEGEFMEKLLKESLPKFGITRAEFDKYHALHKQEDQYRKDLSAANSNYDLYSRTPGMFNNKEEQKEAMQGALDAKALAEKNIQSVQSEMVKTFGGSGMANGDTAKRIADLQARRDEILANPAATETKSLTAKDMAHESAKMHLEQTMGSVHGYRAALKDGGKNAQIISSMYGTQSNIEKTMAKVQAQGGVQAAVNWDAAESRVKSLQQAGQTKAALAEIVKSMGMSEEDARKFGETAGKAFTEQASKINAGIMNTSFVNSAQREARDIYNAAGAVQQGMATYGGGTTVAGRGLAAMEGVQEAAKGMGKFETFTDSKKLTKAVAEIASEGRDIRSYLNPDGTVKTGIDFVAAMGRKQGGHLGINNPFISDDGAVSTGGYIGGKHGFQGNFQAGGASVNYQEGIKNTSDYAHTLAAAAAQGLGFEYDTGAQRMGQAEQTINAVLKAFGAKNIIRGAFSGGGGHGGGGGGGKPKSPATTPNPTPTTSNPAVSAPVNTQSALPVGYTPLSTPVNAATTSGYGGAVVPTIAVTVVGAAATNANASQQQQIVQPTTQTQSANADNGSSSEFQAIKRSLSQNNLQLDEIREVAETAAKWSSRAT
jgi:hypothetical protein